MVFFSISHFCLIFFSRWISSLVQRYNDFVARLAATTSIVCQYGGISALSGDWWAPGVDASGGGSGASAVDKRRPPPLYLTKRLISLISSSIQYKNTPIKPYRLIWNEGLGQKRKMRQGSSFSTFHSFSLIGLVWMICLVVETDCSTSSVYSYLVNKNDELVELYWLDS